MRATDARKRLPAAMRSVFQKLIPQTLRGQIMVVIFVAVILVVTVGNWLSAFRAYMGVEDIDLTNAKAAAVALLVQKAPNAERPKLIEWSAEAGMPLEIVTAESLRDRTAPDPAFPSARWIVGKLFPADNPLSAGGRQIVLDGRPALVFPLDGDLAVVFKGLPDTLVTSDVVGPLSYYILAFVTLLILFSIYASRTLTEPLASITTRLKEVEGDYLAPVFEERGTVELVALARALNEMRARIKKMIEIRTRLLRSVSHDLRTPLTRVRLRIERLKVDSQPIMSDLDNIDALVQETLDYMSSAVSTETLERTDIASLLQTICNEYSDMGQSVSYEGPDKLIGQCKSRALTRAVSNLCDNGIKFAHNVVIRLRSDDARILIEVCDDGQGIAPALRELVTEPFFKADAARKAVGITGGFGLGLSIVAEIVEDHRGRLSFTDNRPNGLIVRIEIPLK
ncbi:HAMP domain-containing sensor histidine kinase [Phyllobacterium sp. 0TCS1.6C]|uniref:sensor histidine kinase n=1 Tax=Phyllobacterium sp. 0TCS1.6C TaxID=2995638 RepID=UPI00226505C0|nr:HAMP domain-containing sensor histidine kinase [Phyllobacterium sp. 0TCS1.6C]MCX8280026.1 HAMP domain-containing sensor histidine kinase [Phyllobacterium sp. 0TCS1.6C]